MLYRVHSMRNYKDSSSKEKSGFDIFIKVCMIIIAAGSILAAIKCVFVGLQIDEEYALTLSYRLLKGDRLLSEVRDPHQTSAFLLSLIEWMWIKLHGGNGYLVIWCRLVTTCIHAVICFYLYKTICLCLDKRYSFIIAMAVFGILPKDLAVAEFSIMMSWFLMLIIIIVFRMSYYYRGKTDFRSVFLSVLLGLSSVALVLSYPTCAIIVAFVLILLAVRKKDFSPFTIPVCLLTMALVTVPYFIYLFSYMTPGEMLSYIRFTVNACNSHEAGFFEKFMDILTDDVPAFAILTAICLLISCIVYLIYKAVRGRKKPDDIPAFVRIYYYMILTAMIIQVISNLTHAIKIRYGYNNLFYIYLMFLPFVLIGALKINPKKLRLTFAIAANILGFIAVMMLTNMNSFRTVKYLTGGLAVSLAASVIIADKYGIKKLSRLVKVLLVIAAFVIIFHKAMYYPDQATDSSNITDVEYRVKNGAAKGVLTEYMVGYTYDSQFGDWIDLIKDGDTVLIWSESTTAYYNRDVSIGSFTTISTPYYYKDYILKYWEENPDKVPDVIAVNGWFGGLRVRDPDGFIDWIENEYKPDEVIIRDYYRYYIRRR